MVNKTIKQLFCGIFLMITLHGSYAHSLRVSDPKSWWKYGKGSIDDVTISIQPKGIYSEVSYYAIMSSRATSYTSSLDTLEAVWSFSLPDEALVVDSWLWVNDEIVRAKIMDKWTARGIYEGIVKRRQDPSILTKVSKNNYELRVFPLVGNSTRKIMLKILVKNDWSMNGDLSLSLPLSILRAAENECCSNNSYTGIPESAKILLKNLSNFSVKSATSVSTDIPVLDYQDEVNGSYKRVSLPSVHFANGLKLTYTPKTLKDGIYLNSYPISSTEGYYQMVMLPQKTINIPSKRKTVFLVDYDPSKTDITRESLFQYLKSSIKENYLPTDSFAVFFSGLTITGTGSSWIAGDEISKNNVFNAIGENNINTYSSLLSVLSKGTEFVNQGKGGDIILVSASNNGYSTSSSNSLINEIVAGLPVKTRLSVVDVARYNSYNYVNGINYYNDAYFYSSLARFTKGIYCSFSEGYFQNMAVADYQKLLDKALGFNSGSLSAFDINTSLASGFCTGKLTFGNKNATNFELNQPFIQVGKYYGTSPFTIQFSGIYDNIPFSKNISIDANEIAASDSITKTVWHGKYILDQESITPTNNNIISDILYNSIDSRVLSLYTAFLALEPTLGGEVCHTCVDESQTLTNLDVDILRKKDTLDMISVYPMPVRDHSTIVLKVNEPENGSLKLYNMSGNMLKEMDLSSYSRINNEIHVPYNWADDSELPDGVYMLIYNDGLKVKKGKLVLQR
jgi:hypothetical protein